MTESPEKTAFGDADRQFMAHAIGVSRRALGTTAENPPVGCVLVRDGAVIGTGWTAPGGRPHAEVRALEMAGGKAKGSTAYVTLEPCAHHGQTPPCAEALIEAGVARAVVAVEDPDPRVRGQGLAMLRAAGVEVGTGLLEEEARRVLAGFLSRLERGRPHVLLKLAVSADGMIAEQPGRPCAITGPAALARAHLMRAQADAILVGVGTVVADDPALSCRLPGLEARSPIRLVADSALRIPQTSRLIATAEEIPTWIFTTIAGKDRALAMQKAHPHVRIIPVKHDEAGRVSLPALLERLGREGINRLMVEGGAHLARAFVKQALVDAAAIFTAPEKHLGEGGLAALAGLPLESLSQEPFALREELPLGADILRVYDRVE